LIGRYADIFRTYPGRREGTFPEMELEPDWKSFPWDEVFSSDANDVSDVTLPTFRGRKAGSEASGCCCLMKPVYPQGSQSSVTSDAASLNKKLALEFRFLEQFRYFHL